MRQICDRRQMCRGQVIDKSVEERLKSIEVTEGDFGRRFREVNSRVFDC
jgi:hypothetical protein